MARCWFHTLRKQFLCSAWAAPAQIPSLLLSPRTGQGNSSGSVGVGLARSMQGSLFQQGYFKAPWACGNGAGTKGGPACAHPSSSHPGAGTAHSIPAAPGPGSEPSSGSSVCPRRAHSGSLHLELVWRRLSRPKNKNKPCRSMGWHKAWNCANLRAPGGDGIRSPEQITTQPVFRC